MYIAVDGRAVDRLDSRRGERKIMMCSMQNGVCGSKKQSAKWDTLERQSSKVRNPNPKNQNHRVKKPPLSLLASTGGDWGRTPSWWLTAEGNQEMERGHRCFDLGPWKIEDYKVEQNNPH